MARELTPTELDELLGAYALDAVDPDERVQLDAYLERSPAARTALAEMRETAATLAHAGAGAAPDGLWSRIEDALAMDPPELGVVPVPAEVAVRSERRRSVGMRVAWGVAAAGVAAAVLTAVVVTQEMAHQEDRLDRVAASVAHDGMRRAAMAAAADPKARMLRMESPSGSASATVVSMPGGEGFLMGHGVDRLAPGRTYQLWAMTGDPATPRYVSAGVLGRDLEVVAFHAPRGSMGFVVTVEDDDGAIRSSGPTALRGRFT
jgi:hypothetical protein